MKFEYIFVYQPNTYYFDNNEVDEIKKPPTTSLFSAT